MIPLQVIEAGMDFWKDYLMSFFLALDSPNEIVREKCRRMWRLKDGLKIHSDNVMFFFNFSILEEHLHILGFNLIFIEGESFIIAQWSHSIYMAKEQVLSIPVWTDFSNIPSVLQLES